MDMKEYPGAPYQSRHLYVQAGGDPDVTLEQFLQENEDYITIDHPELNNYPRTYIVKKNDNDDDYWIIKLYTPHIGKSGNKTMHEISLQGFNTPRTNGWRSRNRTS